MKQVMSKSKKRENKVQLMYDTNLKDLDKMA